tara:strand:- start:339 stop:641 length:303 start_codon:yes stop_codon:yes gene_type:complete
MGVGNKPDELGEYIMFFWPFPAVLAWLAYLAMSWEWINGRKTKLQSIKIGQYLGILTALCIVVSTPALMIFAAPAIVLACYLMYFHRVTMPNKSNQSERF